MLNNEVISDKYLKIVDLRAGYGKTEIVKNVSLHVGRGEIIAIVGPNGAGKSTLLKACFGLVRIFGGHMEVQGNSIDGLATEDIARRRVSYVPQVGKIFPRLTVDENLELGGYLQRKSPDYRGKLEAVLESASVLKPKLRQRAGTLSGGEQTTLAIARGMMSSPQVLLLDEPSTALSPIATGQLWEYITKLKTTGVAIMLVEQRTREALSHADRGYVLIGGQLARTGPASELLKEDLGALFLGAHRDGVGRMGGLHDLSR